MSFDPPTEWEKGYLSGFIDCDGYLSLIRQKRKNGKPSTLRPTIGLSNSNLVVIEWAYNRFGRRGMRQQSSHPNRFGYKPVHTVAFADRLSREILPHLDLKVKKRQKELLQEALDVKEWSKEYQFYRYNKPLWKRIYSRLGQIREEMIMENRRL